MRFIESMRQAFDALVPPQEVVLHLHVTLCAIDVNSHAPGKLELTCLERTIKAKGGKQIHPLLTGQTSFLLV
jgi:hypothetical protein